MKEDPFVREDHSDRAKHKICPILKKTCLGEACQWWVMDFMEDRKAYRMDCSVTMIARGLTDEALLRLQARG